MSDYEKKIERIEKIIFKLEENDISLEENIKLVEEGLLLTKECNEYLKNAELRINQINPDKEKESFS